jgi:hypothetical protein
MTDNADGTRPDPGPYVSPRWWDDVATDWSAERRAVQVQGIVAAFGAEGVAVGIGPNGDPAEMEYLFVEGEALVRDQDVDRVNRIIGRGDDEPTARRRRTVEGAPSASGLTVVELPPTDDQGNQRDTTQWLRRFDEALGFGVVTPNHVVHICPGGGCPATEPLPSAGPPQPMPTFDPLATGEGVRVVVLDSGLLEDVRDEHPWLAGVTGDPEPGGVGRYRGHGTFIAGIVRTVAPLAEVIVRRLFIVEGAVLEDQLADALTTALADTPDIISMSAGTTTRGGYPLLAMESFHDKQLSRVKGTVLVAAAGNDGNRGPFWPAAYPWAVSVGALDVDGSRAGYSNYGSWVDVYARGTDMVNAYPRGVFTYTEPPFAPQQTTFLTGMANWSGTSFSTPVVAGLIAARMTWSGESGRLSADALLQLARRNARVGVGAVLEPDAARPGEV